MPPKIENPTLTAFSIISHWAMSMTMWTDFIQDYPRMWKTGVPWYCNAFFHTALLFSVVGMYVILGLLYHAIKSSLNWRRATNRPSAAPHSRRIRADRTARDSQARPSKGKAEYMALPGELRIQIMKHVLMPGNVYLPQMGPTMSEYIITPPPKPLSKRSFRDKFWKAFEQSEQFWENIIVHGISDMHSGKNSLYPPPGAPEGRRQLLNDGGSVHGFQLLATSKAVMREGQAFFWGQNTFYLLRGGSEAAVYYFDNVRHEHKALIRCIGIQFSLQDLTPPILRALEEYVRAHPTMLGRRMETLTDTEWARWCGSVAVKLWEEKVRWICHWDYLNRVVLEFPSLYLSLPIEGERLRERMKGILIGTGASWSTYSPFGARRHGIPEFDDSVRELERKVGVVVGRIGWLGFKQWLNGEVDYEEDWNNRE